MHILNVPSEVYWLLLDLFIKIVGKLPDFIKNKIDIPLWIIRKYRLKLEIKDVVGKSATLTKIVELRPTQKGLTEFVHRSIYMDGDAHKFRCGQDSKIDIVDPEYIKKDKSEYLIRERFVKDHNFNRDEILEAGKVIKSHFSFDMKNSFLKSHETLDYHVNYLTSDIKIKIKFPRGRIARNPKISRHIGGRYKKLPNPMLSQDGLTISWEENKLWRIGEVYTIEWDW